LSEILDQTSQIPVGKLAYFRERFRNALHQMVLKEFLKKNADGLTRADLARRIGRRPEQITRWLGAPGNWTIDTVSDLMLAMGQEPRCTPGRLDDLPRRNYERPEWLPAQAIADVAMAAQVPPANWSSGTTAGLSFQIKGQGHGKPRAG
jgi:hypothetical protein